MIASALGAQGGGIDVADDKLELARSLGAAATVNAKSVASSYCGACVESFFDAHQPRGHNACNDLSNPQVATARNCY